MIAPLVTLLVILVGLLAGTITGLIPGIHVNTFSAIIVSLTPILLTFIPPLPLIILIVSMATTHTFLNFIPSIFLGAPDSDTALSILPGHKLLNQGRGYIAVIYSLHGSLLGLLIILLFTPLFIFLLPLVYPFLKNVIFIIILLVSFLLILREENSKFVAFLIFSLAGFLGIASTSLITKNNSLLPLLTGLFGASSLLTSILKKEEIPPQKTGSLKEVLEDSISEIKYNLKKLGKVSLASILAAPLCCFFPSLGSSQAALIGSELTKKIDRERFLTLLGSINTIVAGLAFIAFYSINKSRTGAVVAVQKIMPNLSLNQLLLILFTVLFSGFLATFLCVYLGKYFAKLIPKINYTYLSLSVITFLSFLVIYFSGLKGLLIFIVSASLGLACIFSGVRRTHLMGSLMIPTLIFYLPL